MQTQKTQVAIVDQIVFERVLPGSGLAMADGSGYWAFSLFVGERCEAVGSAPELSQAMMMAWLRADLEVGMKKHG
jgi:hypothetical protein